MSTPLAGTPHLVRLILRRDRVQLPLWILGLGGVIAWSAIAVPAIYDTPAKIAGYAATVGDSPVSHLMSGRQAGIDTIGGITANEISQIAQLGVCLMVMFQVVRHTRAEEEAGRAELLRSTNLGRHAATVAALGYAVLTTTLIGLITTAAMLGVGLDPTGSLAYGVGLTLLGICYAAIGLVAAQLSASARGALGIAGAAIALGYLVARARRDAGQRARVALTVRLGPTDERVRRRALVAGPPAARGHRRACSPSPPTSPYAATSAGGLLQPRPGRPRATGALGTPFGLALRIQRGPLIGWSAGLFLLALIYGAVIPTIPDLIASNPEIAQYLGVSAAAGQALIDAFLRYILLFMAVVSTGFGVSTVLRLRSEEESGRAEAVLATGVSRTRWVGGHRRRRRAGVLRRGHADGSRSGLGLRARHRRVGHDVRGLGTARLPPRRARGHRIRRRNRRHVPALVNARLGSGRRHLLPDHAR